VAVQSEAAQEQGSQPRVWYICLVAERRSKSHAQHCLDTSEIVRVQLGIRVAKKKLVKTKVKNSSLVDAVVVVDGRVGCRCLVLSANASKCTTSGRQVKHPGI
jgi:hypothetical protein